MELSTTNPFNYQDKIFILLVIPLINIVNYYLTYSSIHFNSYLLTTYVIDTLEGYAAWFSARYIILTLDQKFPWELGLIRRLVLQLVTTMLICLGVIVALTELVNFIVSDQPVKRSFYTYNLFIFAIWVLVMNGVYIGLYYFKLYRQAIEKQKQMQWQLPTNGTIPPQLGSAAETPTKQPPTFRVQLGNKELLVPTPEILAIYVVDDINLLYTHEKRKLVLDMSLDKCEQYLDPDQFFRANRQCILRNDTVKAIEKDVNGKLLVTLQEKLDMPSPVIISRTKAASFKKWLRRELI
ncbi:hypothetical protein AHMF7605_28690 [Adhaeribacter arboris]|uniref:HTH LytTR-type domain-containing protein n=1 Tax=Adhaeribacter arboris TaxID=2072846 RepID=A0A2T2Y8N9_9BACT|nr:LytTR family DNA-binding domain-containing protein [Adhaeribacter arboris]PSR51891.1 hypothetical protein AHMF7605_28690 [Adhaeribacter arboris]